MGLTDSLYRIKEFIVSGLHSLPIILTSVSLVLACSTANTGFAVLFVFLSIAVPLVVALLNMGAPFLQIVFNFINDRFINKEKPINWSMPSSDVCKIAPLLGAATGADASIAGYPTYWTGIISFFFGFVFANGLALFQYVSNDKTPAEKSDARKMHAVVGMILSVSLYIILMIWRIMTGCESGSIAGILLAMSLALGIAIGGFFTFRELNKCGLLRVIDIFGIGARLLPASATAEPTQVCFPVG
jgi:hypothetical protein